MNKQEIIDKILLHDLTTMQVLHYMSRSIVLRIGPDITKDWVWNAERLPYYEIDDLKELLDELDKNAPRL